MAEIPKLCLKVTLKQNQIHKSFMKIKSQYQRCPVLRCRDFSNEITPRRGQIR